MSTLTVNTVDSKKFQMNETTSDNVTIPSTKSALIVGPVTINSLTVDGNLNVIGDITITNDFTINGSKVIVSENLEVGGSCTVSSSSTLKVVGSINVASFPLTLCICNLISTPDVQVDCIPIVASALPPIMN